MLENQNIEWKQGWHDDYIKWICGFANARGGTIYIGKDDKGQVIGLANSATLMDVIPNKIRNLLGIISEVNLHEEHSKSYLEIITQPYSVPVSLRGRYYYRSGSTKMELIGNALNEFLLAKSGNTWDNVLEPGIDISEIDETSLSHFLRDAIQSGRMPNISGLSIIEVLDKLRLYRNGKIKRAAIILFGKDPNRYYPNVVVKIGRFGKDDADLRFQETLEGNLMQLLQTVPHGLNQKFLTRQIDFEGLHRVEKGEYPAAALREMLINAMVHRSYMGSMIQLRVHDNKLSIWNEGTLPEGMDIDSLKRHHPSRPRNLLIADICFKAGYIDSWGRARSKFSIHVKMPDYRSQSYLS